ncbi:MAG TPA: type II secretion system protein N [Candidatus Babeliales bacterium]|nr:type II secretion system protein N [Candidatus Babeliales bacterium]
MKQPLWILNSILFLMLLACLIFVFFYKVDFPKQYSIKPEVYTPSTMKDSSIDQSKIYLNDLFNTYQPPQIQPKEPELVKEPPRPPQPVTPSIPQPATPRFLEPLSITLSGVFAFTDETKNKAFITNNKSKKESAYKVGDEIEDAQILRIYENRVILIRSNGQQETLFLQQTQVEKYTSPWFRKSWNTVIRKTGPNKYLIDQNEFIKEIPRLGTLIDMLDLTTVYKQGTSVGCKIGNLDDNALVHALGFQTDDIIKTINNIPAAKTANRMEIYKHIVTLKNSATVNVQLLRKDKPISIVVKLGSLSTIETQPEGKAAKSDGKPLTREQRLQETRENVDILKRSKQFAQTQYEIAQDERKQILNHKKQRKLFK